MCAQGIPTPIPDCLPRDHPGHPTLCTDAIITSCESRLRRSGYPSVVLEAHGISGSQHARWLTLAQRDEDNGLDVSSSQFIKYRQAVQRAQAERELSLAETVAEAAESGPQYWAAGMTYLERRHPDRWGRREPVAPAADVRVQIIHYGGTGSAPVVPIVEVRQLPAPAPDGASP